MTVTLTKPETTRTATTRTADLLAAAKDVNKPIGRVVAPVLAGVRISSGNGMLHLSRYNYEIAITKNVPASVGEGDIGPVLVSSASLASALALLDQSTHLAVGIERDKFVITQGAKRVELALMPIEDFPDLPPSVGGVRLPLLDDNFLTTGAALKTLANAITPFAGKDDMLPVLTGAWLQLDGDTLTAATTDRFRLGVYTTPVKSSSDNVVTSIVPQIGDIASVLAADEEVRVSFAGSTNETKFAHFVSFSTTINIRTFDGEFPKVLSLFPTDFTTTASFEPLAFLKSVKFTASGLQRNQALRVVVDQDIALEAEGDDITLTDKVRAITTGDPLVTGFNPTLLTSAVKVFGKGHDVTMSSTSGTKPSVFTSDAIPTLRVLLMPRRLLS